MIADLHQRYLAQAAWTASLRKSILNQIHLAPRSRVLEVGSGTGAICAEIRQLSGAEPVGVDLSWEALSFARVHYPDLRQVHADGYQLPFAEHTFDFVFCHFLLLWVADLPRMLGEIRRVAKPGAWICAFAEPDYGGRIDFPAELESLARLQEEGLRRVGAQPRVGRRLLSEFAHAGLVGVEAGLLGGQWRATDLAEADLTEAMTLQADLQELVKPEEWENWRRIDAAARVKGERILFVPTFYALGRAPRA